MSQEIPAAPAERRMERPRDVFTEALAAIRKLDLIPHENRATLEESVRGIAPTPALQREIETQLSERWGDSERSYTNPRDEFMEKALLALTLTRYDGDFRSFEYLGSGTDAYDTHAINDRPGITDIFVRHRGAKGERQPRTLNLRIDVTAGYDVLVKKVGRILNDMDRRFGRKLRHVKFREGETTLQADNLTNVPLVVLALGENTLNELARLFTDLERSRRRGGDAFDKAWHKIEYHPVQLVLLQQMQAQLSAYAARTTHMHRTFFERGRALDQELEGLAQTTSAAPDPKVQERWRRVFNDSHSIAPQDKEARALRERLLSLPAAPEVERIVAGYRELAREKTWAQALSKSLVQELKAIEDIRQERIAVLREKNPEALQYVSHDPLHVRLMTLIKNPDLLEKASDLTKGEWDQFFALKKAAREQGE